jgi:hypothetical protein
LASEGAPPVSTTPVASIAIVTAGFDDTAGQFAMNINDAGGKFVPGMSTTLLANNGSNIRLLTY